ncbi:exodeoxyribonuclease VII small subunit [Clostridium botulinum C]|uniref:Exodeoxyribonuclease 7 small subunit n=3 Tax=Clostridium botulinum TaxID=1491 RepID=A0A9Q4TMX9_CLOBO|nr:MULTISPECIES: exodeoxyribonuclease VII small subunit [Clostridium]EGO87021.1 exodeoxyribonuclease VII small subunit [Clostridium botulinum C str. Stockholm]EES90564.1 exodeoxyribonuclease VII, small subunit [Clostridium botulinum D str. 1873]KEI10578.1 exodeoxyribonuclease VII small subunit [Clostridium sp. K25]MBO3441970.1 exodeoxyribonuclease VII small subunit [Clostridium haemolyticum]MCD3194179.1 exodeoxyribonuclease VII small subunit [Clostridium botulinum C]
MARKKETYESLMSKLQEVVNEMESEEISLENSMKNYEEGIKICNKLYKMLNEAEAKIKVLSGNQEKEFAGNDD